MKYSNKLLNRSQKAFILIATCFCFSFAKAQNKSNRGKEFWAGYSFSSNFFAHAGLSDPVNQQQMALYISTQQAANVTVSINGTSWSSTLAIPANTVDASILIPKTGASDARILTDGLSGRGVHIVSDVPVAVYSHEYDAMFSAATMLMPVDTWGYTYYSVNYSQTRGQSNPPYSQASGGVNFPDWYNWFYVTATEDNTRINITPTDTTKNGWLLGQTYTVNLNKGEIYTVFGKANFGAGWFSDTVNSSKDLTGSKIVSITGADGNCHPIALFSGSGGEHICQKDGGEAMQQQMFPLQAWGNRYLTYHTINNFAGNINTTFRNFYRVCVKDPTSIVKRNGIALTGLIRNFYYEFVDSTGGDYIVCDKPILVAQFTPNAAQCWMSISPAQTAIGDPEMFYLSPIEQGQKSVTFYASSHNLISKSFLNILVPTAGLSSLLVDGAFVAASRIKVHPNNPSYSLAVADITSTLDMPHTITSDSAFTATVYGLGSYESYGYNIGCNINNLNNLGAIKNTFGLVQNTDTVTCLKSPFRFVVKLAYKLTQIKWNLSQVTGLAPNADSIINNPIPYDSGIINGRKYYYYSLQQDYIFNNIGTYTIPISYTSPDIDACNNTETFNLIITAKNGPSADFTFTNPVCIKDSVYFNGMVNANGFNMVQYKWDFADATTANTLNTVKKFNTASTQNVRFRAIADNGCTADTTKPITIYDSPKSKFGVSTPICAGDSVLITDSSSILNGNITSWQYFFGDGTSVIKNNNNPFYHTYLIGGNYTIKLITNSNNNCKGDTATKIITVNPKPVSKFGVDRNICAGDSIRITDSSNITSGQIISWAYDFGDGNTLVKNNNLPFYHKYNSAGTFIIQLITSSNMGCKSDTFSLAAIVTNKPIATMIVFGQTCIDSIFNYTSSYTNTNNTTWKWIFGDGTIFNSTTSNTTTHTYTNVQSNVVIKHFVDIGGGCISDTVFTTIPLIHKNPIVNFSILKDTLCELKPIPFSSTTKGINIWYWNFGNGTGNDVPRFTKIYTTAGTYNISLTVKDTAGCGSLPVTDVVKVNAAPIVNAGVDKFIQKGSSVLLDATVSPNSSYAYVWTPPSDLTAANILQPTANPATNTNYVLKVEDINSHCNGSDAVMVQVIDKLFIPTAFTPNGDNVNDLWRIPGMALYPDGVVIIYNRYGQKIYETKNYYSHPWDGNINGEKQPTGTYVYFISLNDGSNQMLKGTVTLFR